MVILVTQTIEDMRIRRTATHHPDQSRAAEQAAEQVAVSEKCSPTYDKKLVSLKYTV